MFSIINQTELLLIVSIVINMWDVITNLQGKFNFNLEVSSI